MPKRIAYIVLLFLALPAMAAETIVVGTVTDAESGLPVSGANIYYKGTRIGCASSEEGFFMLRTDLDKTRTLVISALGYKTQRYKVAPGAYGGIEAELTPEATWIGEILALPGENPALALMERVRTARKQNDISQHPERQYTIEEQKNLFISDIRSKHLRRSLWKGLQQGMIQTEDSQLVIPLYLSRQQWTVQGQSISPAGVPEERSALLTSTNYSVLLDGIGHRLNFYENTLTIFGHNFLSPLATSSGNHYNYWLVDSVSIVPDSTIEGVQPISKKLYILHFRSRNPYDPSFNGEMTIDSATCALQSISVSVPQTVHVNYLRSLQVRQTYSGMLPEEESLSMVFDFAIKADTSHIFPTALLTRHTFLKGDDYTPTDTSLQPIVPLSDSTLYVSATGTTSPQDSVAAAAMSALEQRPIIKIAKFIAHIVNTGNIPTGTAVDIGNVVEIVGGSRQEGLHIGMPLTTNERLWKNVELSGYVGYGFKDKALKYKAQVRWRLPSARRHIVGLYYWDHYVYSDISTLDCLARENSIFYGDQDFSYRLFRDLQYAGQTADPIVRRREFNLWTENDWNNHIETQFAIRIGRMGYGESLGYQSDSYRFKTLQAIFRIGWDERKADLFMRRYRIHSRYPIIRLMLEGGSYRLDDMEQEELYARIGIQVQQTIRPGICGRIDYMAQAGVVLGTVPYPLLEHFAGNQTYTYDPYRFTLMNTCQYAADRYVLGHVHWNLQGVLFNRIPGIRYLRLQELLEVKAAWGWLSERHATVIPLPYGMKAMRVPYVEVGAGIGNILRVADLYAVFRLTDFKNTTAPWWGIKARFSSGL